MLAAAVVLKPWWLYQFALVVVVVVVDAVTVVAFRNNIEMVNPNPVNSSRNHPVDMVVPNYYDYSYRW